MVGNFFHTWLSLLNALAFLPSLASFRQVIEKALFQLILFWIKGVKCCNIFKNSYYIYFGYNAPYNTDYRVYLFTLEQTVTQLSKTFSLKMSRRIKIKCCQCGQLNTVEYALFNHKTAGHPLSNYWTVGHTLYNHWTAGPTLSDYWTVGHALSNHQTIKYALSNYRTVGYPLSNQCTVGHKLLNHPTIE